jgi:hypothetical protein
VVLRSGDSPWEQQFWHASEYLRIHSTEYLAAFDDSLSTIDIKGIYPPSPDSALVDSLHLSCPGFAGVGGGTAPAVRAEVRLSVSGLLRGSRAIGLEVELPARMAVRLAVYDIAGRRRSIIQDGELPGGTTQVTWDGKDEAGVTVPSGVYFVRLTCARGARASKVVMIR